MLCLATQLCPIHWDPMDCSPPGSSVHVDSPGKNTRVGCHTLLQRSFPTQESNWDLQHYRRILYHLSYQGSPHSRLDHPLCFPACSAELSIKQMLLQLYPFSAVPLFKKCHIQQNLVVSLCQSDGSLVCNMQWMRVTGLDTIDRKSTNVLG